MQLLTILALLMMGGNSDLTSFLKEVEPLLSGSGDLQKSIKEAGQLSNIISSLQSAGDIFSYSNPVKKEGHNNVSEASPLAPISAIADKNIANCLTKYLSEDG